MPRALVVDDDDSIREITQIALEVVAGWEVVTAASGASAIELAAEHQPDVVVLDLMMPDMDGLATFGHLRAQASTAHIPVVLLTAKVQVGDRQLWDEMAVAGVISKPFDPMTLADQITTMLERG
ncbi:response regulator [Nocardioides marmotae]|uniref:Response regulator n=1 Tax=Nocardioides marmotae TaxID=2663857 RepID=A0A6I3JGS0_9ACTN|nr:response regulator [Nocardioides marmotae]MCR6033709.1 response regulator [Gordonia jinghuaiqii]MBC9735121.1 response regulator [Nocardioides marmotae]MTB86221.1 response regulator [Nocardioides marmotae]MTB97367.1 response regulator [Nocardioides marmotae]QKE01706.1 response regulator [Nocardioides marmotae]